MAVNGSVMSVTFSGSQETDLIVILNDRFFYNTYVPGELFCIMWKNVQIIAHTDLYMVMILSYV